MFKSTVPCGRVDVIGQASLMYESEALQQRGVYEREFRPIVAVGTPKGIMDDFLALQTGKRSTCLCAEKLSVSSGQVFVNLRGNEPQFRITFKHSACAEILRTLFAGFD